VGINTNTAGFTIIETLLFLAISGLMLLVALNAITGRSELVRFQQSIRALEAYIQLQQNYVINGVVPDGTAVSCNGGNECLILGRAIEFEEGTSDIKVHLITGSRLKDDGTGDPAVTIEEARPFVVSNVEANDIDWAVTFQTGLMPLAGPTPTKSKDNRIVAFMRLPNGTEIIPIGFAAVAADTAVVLGQGCAYEPNSAACSAQSTIDEAFSTEFCFESGGRFAKLNLGGGERRQAIEAEFLEGVSCAV